MCVYYLAISRLFIMIDRCVYYLAISRLPINQFNKKYLTKVFNIYYYLLAWFVTYRMYDNIWILSKPPYI